MFNEEKAIRLSAVNGCIRIIAETVASLPFFVYKRLDRGKEKAVDHLLFYILHNKPNEDITSFSYRETILNHLLLWGNSYNQIIENTYFSCKYLFQLTFFLINL